MYFVSRGRKGGPLNFNIRHLEVLLAGGASPPAAAAAFSECGLSLYFQVSFRNVTYIRSGLKKMDSEFLPDSRARDLSL